MGYRVLLVDDDHEFRQEYGEYLRNFYEVLTAANREETLSVLKTPHDIDVVILDERMSDGKGTEMVKDIRKIVPNIGIILLTAYGSKEMVINALRFKVDDYLEKPEDLNKIHDSINRIVASRGGQNSIECHRNGAKIERVKGLLEKNSHKKVTLQETSAVVCLSPKYLSRMFKQNAGISFNKYKLGIKLVQAKKLLKETTDTVEEISEKLGYQNPESFMRFFKRSCGSTPSQFRRHASKKKDSLSSKASTRRK